MRHEQTCSQGVVTKLGTLRVLETEEGESHESHSEQPAS